MPSFFRHVFTQQLGNASHTPLWHRSTVIQCASLLTVHQSFHILVPRHSLMTHPKPEKLRHKSSRMPVSRSPRVDYAAESSPGLSFQLTHLRRRCFPASPAPTTAREVSPPLAGLVLSGDSILTRRCALIAHEMNVSGLQRCRDRLGAGQERARPGRDGSDWTDGRGGPGLTATASRTPDRNTDVDHLYSWRSNQPSPRCENAHTLGGRRCIRARICCLCM